MKKQRMIIPMLAVAGLLFGACSMSGTTADQSVPQEQQPGNITSQNMPSQGDPQASGRPNPSGAPKMDYATVASKLEVTEAALKSAMEGTDGKRVTLSEAAKTLNVTEAALRTALGIPEGQGKGQQQGRPQGSPPPEAK